MRIDLDKPIPLRLWRVLRPIMLGALVALLTWLGYIIVAVLSKVATL